jgi:predicted alpha/beta-fold hydrolase
MPLIAPSSYQPPARLWNGHLQTIIPSLFRKVTVSYDRERIETPDDDFLDMDWAFSVNSQQSAASRESDPASCWSLLTATCKLSGYSVPWPGR